MIKKFVKKALEEDVGRGDLFSLVGKDSFASANIICKDMGVFAGRPYVKALCKMNKLDVTFYFEDGDALQKGDLVALIEGKSKNILRCERTILNLMQHASGIASNVASYKKVLQGYTLKLLDTRKTRPHLRVFEKYAIRCGGGSNHRMGLDDCLMIKDTHLKTIDDLKIFIAEAREKLPFTCKIEIESEDVEFAEFSMQCGADIVMCDNMSHEDIKAVVAYKNSHFPHVLLEASGNITKDNIIEYAKTGVDAISSGSLIHQAVWLDFSMKITHKTVI
ncbi:carboxylating nicotinate-nucleotide diphosphorylase [Sulfurospirillum diekertiae]|uniref:nicotinate-nucleotide diphosphorylase (carboxylating) n=1 Tax=Sulfurospirillum diekertiae TaxID=1854492 RepID=A0A1Y0HHM1_9BACT|nr:carboxylating nicotinate-nucleotide diphosphorylase [Sulfurospirillum diekertiae]ARU47460.1 putative nicotinate-nucleotide pyrophosphorylase [carboxylating] [Sulfurospirillum diekertiae]ASC92309.1 putative nicotinate-nucleotide pyrophosphorylase [carboxylating] [Sulfurospirillum diekertiae]